MNAQLATFKTPAVENEPMVSKRKQGVSTIRIEVGLSTDSHLLRGVMHLGLRSDVDWKLRSDNWNKSYRSKYRVSSTESQFVCLSPLDYMHTFP